MDHFKVLKRALTVTWRYPPLWLFGILLAIVSGGGGFNGGGGGGGGGGDGGFGGGPSIPPEAIPIIMGVVLAICALAIVLALIFAIVRYVAETALIGMVNEIEETGDTSIRSGFRHGWSRSAWRLFLMDLVIGIPVVIAALVLMAFAASPLMLLFIDNTVARVIGIVGAVGLFLIWILLMIVVAAAVSLLKEIARRQCVLGDKGVLDSIGDGYWMIRRNLDDVGVMWLITIGVGIAWGIVMIPVVLILLALFLAIGAVLAGGPALLLYAITQAEALAVVTAVAIAIPVFLLVFVAPLIFLQGLYLTFRSSTWTLTYREVWAKEAAVEHPAEEQEISDIPQEPGEVDA